MKDFTAPIAQRVLDIADKNRSNPFTWRGQFSPQLIEALLDAYCLPNSVILDPFAGSGTVLLEAARMELPAYGFELNPAAWTFSKLYEFSNVSPRTRQAAISELKKEIENEFPIIIFAEDELHPKEVEERIIRISGSISDQAKILCNALVVLLDIYHHRISGDFVQSRFMALAKLVRGLPYSKRQIKADLRDARQMPLEDESIDFAITSPPYINVFNYHQNYRRSVETLGWDVLRVARSEIGSNRANRGNRFRTVVQYCIDMACSLQELARVVRPRGRAVFIVGYESRVLGAPFYNAKLIEQLATGLGMFDLIQQQSRRFQNRFGKSIREDILNFTRTSYHSGYDLAAESGKHVARTALAAAAPHVLDKNRELLTQAMSETNRILGTPIFDGGSYVHYHTRDRVMMVREEQDERNYET